MRRLLTLALVLALASLRAPRALADGGLPAPQDLDAGAAGSVHGCVPSRTEGANRPVVTEDFPRRGTSGWIATLTVTVRHGRGEHVLPSGIDLQRSSEAEKELKASGFTFPEQDGGTGAARLVVLPEDPARKEIVTTVLEVPVIPLPEKPGRNSLVLPPLPVAVARANGELTTLCTRPHSIVVEDPIAETNDPAPRPNPPPRPQREEWTELKYALAYVGGGLVLGTLAALAYRRWKRRPRPVPPPPPPRPAWELALERLHGVRHAGLLETDRQAEFCDRVSDAIREYLGARLEFDGLESTTDEIAAHVARAPMIEAERARVVGLLRDCDLVKFAKFSPSRDACDAMLDAAEAHVRATMPRREAPAPSLDASAPGPEIKDAPDAGDASDAREDDP